MSTKAGLPPANDTLAAKVAAVAARIDRLEKSKEMTEGPKYSYTPIEDIVAAITGHMAELGVAMLPTQVEVISQEALQRGSKTAWRYLYRFTWTLTDGKDRETVQSMGEAVDYSDKGSNKAQTSARKYAYIDVFHLQMGDDPDGHYPESQRSNGASAPPQPPPSQAPSQPPSQAPAQSGTWKPKVAQENLDIEGRIFWLEDGATIGITFAGKADKGFTDAKDGAKQRLGAKWNGSEKRWEVAGDREEQVRKYADWFGFSVELGDIPSGDEGEPGDDDLPF